MAYSLLLLASTAESGLGRSADDYRTPKWYRGRLRPSVGDMQRRLRIQLHDEQEFLRGIGFEADIKEGATAVAA